MPPSIQSAFGLVAFLALAWLIRERRAPVPWRTVAAGVVLQFVLAAAMLHIGAARELFAALNDAMLALQRATQDGTAFVFGYLGGGELPFAARGPGSSFVLAFQALPLVLVVSALSAVLYHWRVLPAVVRALSLGLERVMGVGGALAVGAAANVFVGMVESPLFVRPYLSRMSRGELFAVMSCGMATVAGTVMVLYASFLAPTVPGAMGHILTASIISAPAAIAVAVLMVPPEGAPTGGVLVVQRESSSTMDAVTRGTVQGLELLLNIIAMLLVLVALVSLVNRALGLLPDVGGEPLSLQRALALVFAPLMWLVGVPWQEVPAAASLMGTKTVINELVAYLDLAALPDGVLSPRSRLLLVYAMCGFANFGSLGIMIGGLGALLPERRAEIAALGLKTIVAGTLATCMTAAVVGIVVPAVE
jgi:CNT family concentrative nucleoside transporter